MGISYRLKLITYKIYFINLHVSHCFLYHIISYSFQVHFSFLPKRKMFILLSRVVGIVNSVSLCISENVFSLFSPPKANLADTLRLVFFLSSLEILLHCLQVFVILMRNLLVVQLPFFEVLNIVLHR